MVVFLRVLLIVIAALLVISILSQARGAGLSETFGGSGSSFHHVRRGPEKILFTATIVLAVLFCAIAFVIPFLV